jgi:DsbC/DsbD-like thiol-disulfide interchange protein
MIFSLYKTPDTISNSVFNLTLQIMKRLILITLLIGSFSCLHAQFIKDPVTWSYAVKKTARDAYKIYVRAKIQRGWHIYAQRQPKDAIATPTSFIFSADCAVTPLGPPDEVGERHVEKLEMLHGSQYYYEDKVDFVQTIYYSAKLPVKISCKVKYMACNSSRCLPETEIQMMIPIEN